MAYVVCLVVVLSSVSAPHQVLLIVATLCSTQDNAEALVDLDLLGVIGDALRTHPTLAGIVVQCVKMISSIGSMTEVRIYCLSACAVRYFISYAAATSTSRESGADGSAGVGRWCGAHSHGLAEEQGVAKDHRCVYHWYCCWFWSTVPAD